MKKEKINKINNRKGSALVISLMVLFIMLISALSIAFVYVRQRKASMANSKTNQSIQRVITGLEEVKEDIIGENREFVKDIKNCTNADDYIVKGEEYRVRLLDENDGPVSCKIDGDMKTNKINELHSYSTVSGLQRDFSANLKTNSTKLLMHFDNNKLIDPLDPASCGRCKTLDLDEAGHYVKKEGDISSPDDENDCKIEDDKGGNKNGCAVFKAPTVAGEFSYFEVDSSDPGNKYDFEFRFQDFTIETWVNMKLSDYPLVKEVPTIVRKVGEFNLYYDIDKEELVFEYSTDGGLNYNSLKSNRLSRGSFMDESWKHVVVERKDRELHFFVDGIDLGSKPFNIDLKGTGNIVIGK